METIGEKRVRYWEQKQSKRKRLRNIFLREKENGLTNAQIADKYGYAESTVMNLVNHDF